VAKVILDDALDISQAHGQRGLGTVQGLNLVFLIDASLSGLPDAPVGASGGFAGERALEQGGNLLVFDAACRPGRNSSSSPAKQCPTNPCRHLPTVAFLQRRRRATRAWAKVREGARLRQNSDLSGAALERAVEDLFHERLYSR
jgi:hypothetical protein